MIDPGATIPPEGYSGGNMRKLKTAVGVMAAAAAVVAVAAAPALAAGETNEWTMYYGNSTAKGTNAWSEQSVGIAGNHYIPSGANQCRRIYAVGLTVAYVPIGEDGSSAWKCFEGVHPVSVPVRTTTDGGPAWVLIRWEQKATAATPDSARTVIGHRYCKRSSFDCFV
ncbi:hypothetical protein ACIHCQ_12485 [Streptomyces sp. NPDC052236]|uniref:hypothetical protein n=1 Tax=Streptomyces sp. NPDC052236 TaxID=3365686 RepID=UPI0037D046D2